MLVCLQGVLVNVGCDHPESSAVHDHGSGEFHETGARSNVTLGKDTLLTEIRAKLGRLGAVDFDHAYHLPWGDIDGSSGGYHEYHHLTDGTCLQLKIRNDEDGDRVIEFALGPAGKGYVDKLEWFSDDEKGLITRSSKVTFSVPH